MNNHLITSLAQPSQASDKLNLLGLLVILSLVAGCLTMQTYSGPKLPESQVAIVEENTSFLTGKHLQITSADGVNVPPFTSQVELLPGQHILWFTFSKHRVGVTIYGNNPCQVTFQAEAGRRYEVNGEINEQGIWNGWLEDKATGAVVARGYFVQKVKR